MDVWVELVCVEGDEWSMFVLRRERERSMDGRRREYGRVWVCIYTRSSLLRTWGQPCDMSQSMRSCRRFHNDITRLEPRSEMGANPFVSRHLPPASDQVGLLRSSNVINPELTTTTTTNTNDQMTVRPAGTTPTTIAWNQPCCFDPLDRKLTRFPDR